jgi:hypothetical protein
MLGILIHEEPLLWWYLIWTENGILEEDPRVECLRPPCKFWILRTWISGLVCECVVLCCLHFAVQAV